MPILHVYVVFQTGKNVKWQDHVSNMKAEIMVEIKCLGNDMASEAVHGKGVLTQEQAMKEHDATYTRKHSPTMCMSKHTFLHLSRRPGVTTQEGPQYGVEGRQWPSMQRKMKWAVRRDQAHWTSLTRQVCGRALHQ